MPQLLRSLLVVLAVAAPAAAVEYLSWEQALRVLVPEASRVDQRLAEADAERLRAVQERARSRAVGRLRGAYVARDAAGAALAVVYLDGVVGRTEEFLFACALTPAGAVRRIEVLAYQEPVGSEVRDRRFLAQFEGKGADDRLRAGREVRNIAGATMSVTALTERVRWLIAYHQLVTLPALAAAPAPAAPAPTLVERAAPLGDNALAVRAAGVDAAAVESALAAALRLDLVLNQWRPESELARLNATGGGNASRELTAALLEARGVWDATGGRFDPTVGPLVLLWRDSAAAGRLPTAEEVVRAREMVGFDRVRIQDAAGTVTMPAGAALDLGGIAKGRIVDACGAALARNLGSGGSAIVAHGGSSWLALGAADAQLHSVELRSFADPAKPLQRLRLQPGQALGCASASGRTVTIDGVAYSHLVDPLSGKPVPPARGAAVVAPSAALADGLDTALCLVSPAEALAIVARMPGVSALIWDGERLHASPGWAGEEIAARP